MSPAQIAARWHLYRMVQHIASKPINQDVTELVKTGSVFARYK